MGIIDELTRALTPHTERVNQAVSLQGALIHQRLMNIENALITPTVVDRWGRISINNSLPEGVPLELGTVPLNEVWVMQALVTDGVRVTAPAFVVEAAGRLLASVIKEGVGGEKLSGAVVALPGEVVTLTPRATGTVSMCLHFVRKPLESQRIPAQSRSGDVTAPSNTHDPARDQIMHRLGASYTEVPGETRDTTGRPPLARG